MRSKWLAPLLNLFGTNWITLLGANLTTVSAVTILAFLLLGLFGLANSPYIALMALLVLPGIFIFGLLLIPVGLWWERRRSKKEKEEPEDKERPFPVIDLNKTRLRRIVAGVGVLTLFNVLFVALISYEGVAYMDSTEFCGEVCHTVMQPEFRAYQGSAHSKVECVECHIGPGAPWFVRSKLSGMHQVVAVTLDTYERPIPTPVENLRPSQVICEQCHWPGRFTGDRIKVITKYDDDEANTELKTVLVMHIGGGNREQGIHSWHINPERETYYIAGDQRRQEIPWIQVDEGDEIMVFTSGDGVSEESLEGERRRMDCIDCHNRPTHVFKLPPQAMDEAMEHGDVSPEIPFIKRTGVEVLEEVGESLGQAEQVELRLREYYREEYPDYFNEHRQTLEEAIRAIRGIYERNIFPEMKLTWGTYPNNIGHENFPGCFRCHDGEHTTTDGRAIDQDCSTCHTILAWDEENPPILSELELE